MNVTIKDVPQDIHTELKQAARSKGRSLNGYVISLLRESVEDDRHRRLLRERWEEFERFVQSLPPVSDSTPLIREDRDRGH